MELNINITMENHAFFNNNVEEVTRILNEYCKKISKGGELLEGDYETLLDNNGNRVGKAIVS